MGVGKEVCAPADTEFPSHWAARLTVSVRKGNNAAGEAQATCTSSIQEERCLQSFSFWEGDNDDFDQNRSSNLEQTHWVARLTVSLRKGNNAGEASAEEKGT